MCETKVDESTALSPDTSSGGLPSGLDDALADERAIRGGVWISCFVAGTCLACLFLSLVLTGGLEPTGGLPALLSAVGGIGVVLGIPMLMGSSLMLSSAEAESNRRLEAPFPGLAAARAAMLESDTRSTRRAYATALRAARSSYALASSDGKGDAS